MIQLRHPILQRGFLRRGLAWIAHTAHGEPLRSSSAASTLTPVATASHRFAVRFAFLVVADKVGVDHVGAMGGQCRDAAGGADRSPVHTVIVRAHAPIMTRPDNSWALGLGRGKVFPAARAQSLLSPLRRLVQSPRRTVDRMGLDAGGRVLEIGCGPGFFSPDLARVVQPNGRVVLLDLQFEMLQLARERVLNAGNARCTQADALHLPFAAATFDAVLVVLMLGEVPDRTACLKERRVLKRDGVLSIVETRRDSDFIPLRELRADLERLGFRFIDRRGFRWEYTARFRQQDG